MALKFLNNGYFAGKVGIGTNSPGGNLDIKAGMGSSGQFNSAQLRLLSTDMVDATGFQGIRFATSTSDYYGWTMGANRSNNGRGSLRFFEHTGNSSGAERFTIKQDGNVGIGTSSPSTKLDVSGNIRAGVGGTTATDAVLTLDSGNASGGEAYISLQRNSVSGFLLNHSLSSIQVRGLSDLPMHFYTNNAIKQTILSNGNVGIGTTSPSAKLEVAGSVGSFKTTGHQIFLTRNGNNEIYAVGVSSVLALGQNGSEKMRINTDGNVGIGTASPSARLEVSSTATVSDDARYELLITEDNTASAGRGGGLAFTRQGTIYGGIKTLQNTANDDNTSMYFQTRGGGTVSNRMTIDSSGNVGIGTTTPDAKLEVNSGGGIHLSDDVAGRTLIIKPSLSGAVHEFTSDNTAAGYSFSNNAGELMRIASNGKVGIGTDSPDTSTKLSVSTPQSGAASGTGITLSGWNGTSQSKVQLMSYGIDDGTFAIRSGSNNTERMRIDSDGNVGIGTSSPSTKLVVSDSGATGLEISPSDTNAKVSLVAYDRTDFAYRELNYDGLSHVFKTSNTAKAVILGNGNVGIGTTTPAKQLMVRGSAPWIRIEEDSASNKRLDLWVDPTSAIGYIGANQSAQQLSFQTASSDRIRILNNGNVGIGTTTPTEKLHVDGSIELASAWQIGSNSGNYWQRIRTEDSSVITTNAFNFETRNGSGAYLNHLTILNNGNVGIGNTSPNYKLSVSGAIQGGGKITYTKVASSLNTTGYDVAGILASSAGNGLSCGFTFTCFGQANYQKIVYSCYNTGGTWNAIKLIDEGTDKLDIVVSAISGSTITFKYKTRSGTLYYTPRVTVEAVGSSINSTYA